MDTEPFAPQENPFRKHKGIVAIVVGLGVLIIIGFAALVYGIALKASKPDASKAVASMPENPEIVITAGGENTVLAMTAADGIVYITLRLKDGSILLQGFDDQGLPLFSTPMTAD